MKSSNIILLLAFLSIGGFIMFNSFEFDAHSGSKKFDTRLNNINKKALADINQFKECLLATYHADEAELQTLLVEFEPAEVLLTYEISNLTSLTHAEVLGIFRAHKDQGLNETLMALGIKVKSAQFHNLAKLNYDTTIDNNSVISRK